MARAAGGAPAMVVDMMQRCSLSARSVSAAWRGRRFDDMYRAFHSIVTAGDNISPAKFAVAGTP